MINFYNQVPSVYTSASRDFQYLSWLINIVLNAVKHNVDDLYFIPNAKTDPRITELLAMTLGFKLKRNYDQKQLATLVSILPSILKYKGSKTAIMLTGYALVRAAGSTGKFECEIKDNCLEITLPEKQVDTTLFMDLLPYILPAGLTCRVVNNTDDTGDTTTNLAYNDTIIHTGEWVNDLSWNGDSNEIEGLAGLYNVSENNPAFTNYLKVSESEYDLNLGLLANTVIPDVSSEMIGDSLPEPGTTPITPKIGYVLEPNEHGTTVIMHEFDTEPTEHGITTVIEDNQFS